jgi:hypothetical protein
MKYLWEADLNVRSDTGLKMGAIDEFHRRCPMSRYSESLCMGFDVHPEDERDDRLLSRSRVYIASEAKRAAVDAIYATKGEPVKLLRRDQAKVWKKLVTGLHNRLRK